MRPKDLTAPFSWETRKPLFQDGVLFVPRFFRDHAAYRDLFLLKGGKREIFIEFCSGNGEWIAQKAKENPDITWIAVEKQFKRVQKIWSKKQNLNLENLLIVCGVAEDFIEFYLERESVSKIFINFPDPWPKKRHSKHRLMRSDFVKRLSEILVEKGEIILVTDDALYTKEAIEVLEQKKLFVSLCPPPYYEVNQSTYGSSYFDRLWREMGREIRKVHYQKREEEAPV